MEVDIKVAGEELTYNADEDDYDCKDIIVNLQSHYANRFKLIIGDKIYSFNIYEFTKSINMCNTE